MAVLSGGAQLSQYHLWRKFILAIQEELNVATCPWPWKEKNSFPNTADTTQQSPLSPCGAQMLPNENLWSPAVSRDVPHHSAPSLGEPWCQPGTTTTSRCFLAKTHWAVEEQTLLHMCHHLCKSYTYSLSTPESWVQTDGIFLGPLSCELISWLWHWWWQVTLLQQQE